MTHLYLIRHALADGLKPGIIGSVVPNSGLSPLGVAQAKQLHDRLAQTGEIRADVLISSPLLRAKETADIIAPALELPVITDDGLQELNLGEAEGLTVEEFIKRFAIEGGPDNNPFHRIAPGGDSWAEFTLRTCEAFDRLIRQYEGKTIVIVCHGRVLDVSFIYFLGLNTLKQLPIVLNSHLTSITHWFRDHFEEYGRPEPQWCLERYDDHTHLDKMD